MSGCNTGSPTSRQIEEMERRLVAKNHQILQTVAAFAFEARAIHSNYALEVVVWSHAEEIVTETLPFRVGTGESQRSGRGDSAAGNPRTVPATIKDKKPCLQQWMFPHRDIVDSIVLSGAA
eukprot:1553461-Rhodomonas_salina.1